MEVLEVIAGKPQPPRYIERPSLVFPGKTYLEEQPVV